MEYKEEYLKKYFDDFDFFDPECRDKRGTCGQHDRNSNFTIKSLPSHRGVVV